MSLTTWPLPADQPRLCYQCAEAPGGPARGLGTLAVLGVSGYTGYAGPLLLCRSHAAMALGEERVARILNLPDVTVTDPDDPGLPVRDTSD